MTVRRAEPGQFIVPDRSLLSSDVSKLHRQSRCLADSTVYPGMEGGSVNTAVSNMKVSGVWPTSQVRPMILFSETSQHMHRNLSTIARSRDVLCLFLTKMLCIELSELSDTPADRPLAPLARALCPP